MPPQAVSGWLTGAKLSGVGVGNLLRSGYGVAGKFFMGFCVGMCKNWSIFGGKDQSEHSKTYRLMEIRYSSFVHYIKVYHAIHRQLMSKWFQYFVLFFIIGSIASIIFSSFESSAPYRKQLFSFNYVASFVFTVEYLLRLIASPLQFRGKGAWKSRLQYVFSFYGIIDFIAILPFIVIYFYQDTPHVHLVILAYVLIIFKLIRYSRSFRLIGDVLREVREELITAYTACGIMLCFSGILMYYIERSAQPEAFANIGDGCWWAIVAFTTVGYGDIYPITALGRALSSIISLIGIAMIAIPTGIISSSFMNIMLEKRKAALQRPDSGQEKPQGK